MRVPTRNLGNICKLFLLTLTEALTYRLIIQISMYS